jgi:hypothetical protein
MFMRVDSKCAHQVRPPSMAFRKGPRQALRRAPWPRSPQDVEAAWRDYHGLPILWTSFATWISRRLISRVWVVRFSSIQYQTLSITTVITLT